MTGFIYLNAGANVTGTLVVDDRRLVMADAIRASSDFSPPPLHPILIADPNTIYGSALYFGFDWWPARSSQLGDTGISDVASLVYFDDVYPVSGCNGRFSFSGITRDVYGSPVPKCTVRCYRTSTHELQSVVTSDANGLYIATTPYNDAHFLTVHNLTYSIAGASIDTLIAT